MEIHLVKYLLPFRVISYGDVIEESVKECVETYPIIWDDVR